MPVFCLCIVYAGFLYCVSVFFQISFRRSSANFIRTSELFSRLSSITTPELCPGKSGFHKLIAINGKLFDAETFVFFDYILCSPANPLQVIELSAACAVL